MKPTTQRTTSLRGHPGCPPGAVLASSARFKQSTLAGAIKPGRRAVTMVRASAEYDVLKNYPVAKATANEVTNLASLWQPTPGTKVVVAFLTHFADLTSWEYAQRLLKVIPTLESSGVQVVAVGLGSSFNAQEFARVLKFPLDRLYHTQDKSLYRALGFSPGFGEGIEVSPYAKLVPMLLGIGSPGTMQEVIRGYVGDKDSKPVFDSPTPFDVLGTGYQRPLELATQRLFNMIGILPKWSELSPPDQELLTQQGGTLAFDGEDVIFKHIDSGILKYTDTDALLRAVLQADYANAAIDVPSITATVSSSSASSRPGQ